MVCQANHYIQLFQLHVNWVVVFDKEHLHLILQDIRPTIAANNLQVRRLNMYYINIC